MQKQNGPHNEITDRQTTRQKMIGVVSRALASSTRGAIAALEG
jgi:hypothetical protein